MNNARGRPRGGRSDARERLLAAARVRFVRDGYGSTSLRAVARDAGVDAALVAYHFGSKQGLFAEAMALAGSPSGVLRDVLDGDPATFPERLLTAITGTWDDEESRAPLVALVEAALTHGDVRRAFDDYIDREVVTRLADRLGGRRASERATAAVTVVVGLVFSRYVLALPGSAAPSSEEVVRTLAPVLRAALAPPRPRRGS